MRIEKQKKLGYGTEQFAANAHGQPIYFSYPFCMTSLILHRRYHMYMHMIWPGYHYLIPLSSVTLIDTCRFEERQFVENHGIHETINVIIIISDL